MVFFSNLNVDLPNIQEYYRSGLGKLRGIQNVITPSSACPIGLPEKPLMGKSCPTKAAYSEESQRRSWRIPRWIDEHLPVIGASLSSCEFLPTYWKSFL
jgi:hypothetical protein